MNKWVGFFQGLAITTMAVCLAFIAIQSINAEEVTSVKPEKSTIIKVQKFFYDLTPNVQLRLVYHDNDLRYVQLENKGEPMNAKLFGEEYQLGKNDVASIDPPNIDHFIVELEPYSMHTAHTDLMSTAQIRTFHVQVPLQRNTTVEDHHTPIKIKPIKK